MATKDKKLSNQRKVANSGGGSNSPLPTVVNNKDEQSSDSIIGSNEDNLPITNAMPTTGTIDTNNSEEIASEEVTTTTVQQQQQQQEKQQQQKPQPLPHLQQQKNKVLQMKNNRRVVKCPSGKRRPSKKNPLKLKKSTNSGTTVLVLKPSVARTNNSNSKNRCSGQVNAKAKSRLIRNGSVKQQPKPRIKKEQVEDIIEKVIQNAISTLENQYDKNNEESSTISTTTTSKDATKKTKKSRRKPTPSPSSKMVMTVATKRIARQRRPTEKIIQMAEMDECLAQSEADAEQEGEHIENVDEINRNDHQRKQRQKMPLTNNTSYSVDERKVIDMLDLNVKNEVIPTDLNGVLMQRRHTIEKIPITEIIMANSKSSSSPRGGKASPRTVNNHYQTRSDIRTLRNGKRSRHQELIDGLEDHQVSRKRRRQLIYSSNTKPGSGYDSDNSTYSDLSSVHGSSIDGGGVTVKMETPQAHQEEEELIKIELIEEEKSHEGDVEENSADIDTNSNRLIEVYNNQTKEQLLDIMKQTFNEETTLNDDDESENVSSKQAYNNNTNNSENQGAVLNDDNDDDNDHNLKRVRMNLHEEPKELVEDSVEISNGSKECILKALGLQSLRDAEEAAAAKQKLVQEKREKIALNSGQRHVLDGTNSVYSSGTLKTVIKLTGNNHYYHHHYNNHHRERTRRRNPTKITLQSKSSKRKLIDSKGATIDGRSNGDVKQSNGSTGLNHPSGSGMHLKVNSNIGGHQQHSSSDTAGAHRKSHYANRSNLLDGSSEHTSDGEASGVVAGMTPAGAANPENDKLLVIPEKASSFSIHPGRVCNDECFYCFGKFGLFDTPCHIAQIKSVERQNKILCAEKHLTRDSCLCDACYRHVDRKANTPSYMNKTSCKRNALVAPGPKQDHCHVLGCGKMASNILRRKWIIKMRKNICQMMNIDLDNPGLHSIPICDEHFYALEHLMVCALCKRRLAKNHIHYLGPELVEVNAALQAEGVPIQLSDKPVVCKLCKCFTAIIIKADVERPPSTTTFFEDYKKRLLHFNDIVPMDEAAAEEPITVPTREKSILDDTTTSTSTAIPNHNNNSKDQSLNCTKNDALSKRKRHQLRLGHYSNASQNQHNRLSSSSSTNVNDVTFKMDDDVIDTRTPLSSEYQQQLPLPQPPPPDSPLNNDDSIVDFNTLIPSIAMDCGDSDDNDNNTNDIGSSNSVKVHNNVVRGVAEDRSRIQKLGSNPSISVRQLFPFEDELPLQTQLDFGGATVTPEGWERCHSTILYDQRTKRLWHELQKPYGTQSSFLRHLVLLEKYFRNGDLVLAPNASHHSTSYARSVQGRLRAYDNRSSTWPGHKSANNNSNHHRKSTITTTLNKPNPAALLMRKRLSQPPGLISLQPTKAAAPQKQSPSALEPPLPISGGSLQQGICFPLPTDWRPTLIPIDPKSKADERRKIGLLQVISGGLPYHITVEDYKKMCDLKRAVELKQQQQKKKSKLAQNNNNNSNNQLKSRLLTKATTNSSSNPSTNENAPIEAASSKLMARIPSSLTVIPQVTVAAVIGRKPPPIAQQQQRAESPVLLITPNVKQQQSPNNSKPSN